MDILIFIYNIFLIVLYTMVLTFCIINYRHKKRQLTAVLFLFYILDNIIIYMTEFLDGFSVRYDLQFMSAPAFKTLIFLVTSFCLVSIQHQVLPRRRKNSARERAPALWRGRCLPGAGRRLPVSLSAAGAKEAFQKIPETERDPVINPVSHGAGGIPEESHALSAVARDDGAPDGACEGAFGSGAE